MLSTEVVMAERARKRVLIVDDSSHILELTRDALVHAGFDVTIAQDRVEVERAMDDSFDLIMIDVLMPDILGDQLTVMLRNRNSPRALIHLFSAIPESELKGRTLDAGADGYFCKREGISAFVDHVCRTLGRVTP
ncbi:MAG: PleD family two-component system response regulator [Kofleriaceae bacterium]